MFGVSTPNKTNHLTAYQCFERWFSLSPPGAELAKRKSVRDSLSASKHAALAAVERPVVYMGHATCWLLPLLLAGSRVGSADDCTDDNAECESWANMGECSKVRAGMASNARSQH